MKRCLTTRIKMFPPISFTGTTLKFHFGDALKTLPRWDKSVDVDVYLQAFERSAFTSGWPRDKWPVLLRTQLTDRALQVYNEIPQQDEMNYDALKAALLLAFCAVPETHRTRFRTVKKKTMKHIRTLPLLKALL